MSLPWPCSDPLGLHHQRRQFHNSRSVHTRTTVRVSASWTECLQCFCVKFKLDEDAIGAGTDGHGLDLAE